MINDNYSAAAQLQPAWLWSNKCIKQLFENVTRVRPRALVLLISEIWFLNFGVCHCFLLLAGRFLCLCVYGLKMVTASAVMSASWHVVGGPLVHGRGFAEDKGFMRGGYV